MVNLIESEYIDNISIIVIDGLPNEIESQWDHIAPHWIRQRDEDPKKDLIYARIYEVPDSRNWWVVVRACPALLKESKFLGRKAVTVASYKPDTQLENYTRSEFFEKIEDIAFKTTEFDFSIVLRIFIWMLEWLESDDDRAGILDAIKTSDFFVTDQPKYEIREAKTDAELHEIVHLSEQDPLCGNFLFQKKFKRMLSGRKGTILVAYPSFRDSKSTKRIPIIGYCAIIPNDKRGKERVFYMCSLVIEHGFRRHGIATKLLDAARTIAKNCSLVTYLPYTDYYHNAALWLKDYGTKSLLLDDTAFPELSTVNWQAMRFEILPDKAKLKCHISRKSETGVDNMS